MDDQASARIMAELYRHLAAGVNRAMALAEAKRTLRYELEGHLFAPRAHPAFWAPFVLLEHRPSHLHRP